MAIARFLDRMSLALWASGLWLCYAMLQNLSPCPGPSFPLIAPPHPPPLRNGRKGRAQILPSGNLAYHHFISKPCLEGTIVTANISSHQSSLFRPQTMDGVNNAVISHRGACRALRLTLGSMRNQFQRLPENCGQFFMRCTGLCGNKFLFC